MPRKREVQAEVTCFDDDDLLSPHRALKKSKRTQLSVDDDGSKAIASSGAAKKEANGDAKDVANCKHRNASGTAGETECGEEAGDERTRESEDRGELQKVRRHRNHDADSGETDHGPASVQSMPHASSFAPKLTESYTSKDVDNSRSDRESNDDALTNEEIEEGIKPRRGGMVKGHANNDSSQDSSSSSSSSDGDSGEEEEELEDGEKRPDGSTAFGRAFQKIMKKKLPSTALMEAMGPILSAHKQLVAKKLEEAAEDQKAKRESKKAKQVLREKGHTAPALFPSAKDKELLKLATRGVVKLFNAVSKAQSVQEAAVTKDSEAKDVAKQSKSAFLAMLQGGNGAVSNTQRQPSDSKKQQGVADGQPGWSALRETFMLGKSRLKDWDKKEEDAADLIGAGSRGDDSDGSE